MINLQQLNVFIVNERQFTVYILFILKMRTGQESVYTYSQLFFSLLRHTGTLLYRVLYDIILQQLNLYMCVT